MYKPSEKISIIIAAYNEEESIGRAIKEVHAVLPESEIIVVDDGSSDKTYIRAKQFECELVKVIRSPQNSGKGHAIRTGIDAATGTIMAQLDADLQFPPDGFPDILQPIIDGKADIIFGSRYLNVPEKKIIEKGSVSFIKKMASWVVAKMVTVICKQPYTDVFAGFKAWKSDVIRALDIKEPGFTYEAEIAIKAYKRGYSVMEVPTAYKRRSEGESKIKIFYHTFTVAWRIYKLATTP